MISDKHFNERERKDTGDGGRGKINGTVLLHISIPKTMI